MQPTEIEKITAGCKLYQEVDVAVEATFTAGYRSENTHVRSTRKLSQRQNGGTLFELERFKRHCPLLCIIAPH